MNYTDIPQLMDTSLFPDDQSVEMPNILDRERKDLLEREMGIYQLTKYITEEAIPKDSKRAGFFMTDNIKQLSTTFLKPTDEFFILNALDFNNILYSMGRPRSEKSVEEVMAAKEFRVAAFVAMKRSEGFGNTNALTLNASMIRQNVYSMTEQQNRGGGIFGGVKKFLGRF